jgi:hypothetical protein
MLSRRWLFNGLLILLIAVLATLGYRLEVVPAPPSKPAQAGFDTAAVERIEVRTANDQLALQRHRSGWRLAAPLRWPADRANVERLFRIVDTGAATPLQEAAIDLVRFGLDEPAAQLQLGQISVRFGSVNNIGERRYTLIDSALYLLPDVHLPLIQQGISGFIDRRLLPPDFEITALSLPGLELRRDADGAWLAGERRDPSTETLAALVASWQQLAATRIGSYQDPRAPTGRIVARLADGERIELLLLATDPEIVIANPALGLQYHLLGEHYERLFSLPGDENPA